MAEKTGIAWTRSTFNPWAGCTKVSPGCDNCYAEALDKRHRWGGSTHWGYGVPRYRTKNWNGPVSWNAAARREQATGELTARSSWAGRVGFWPVFCASLADVFDNEVPLRWRQDLMDLVADTPNLTWLFLTKRIGLASRMLYGASCHSSYFLTSNDEYKPPENLWIGASVVNQEEADRDIPKLLATPAAKRFVSYEPALGPVDFRMWLGEPISRRRFWLNWLDWVIVGGESAQGGAKARPFDLAWARSTVQQCRDAETPAFIKQLGSCPVEEFSPGCDAFQKFKDRAGADPAEWPEQLRIQEFPA